MKYTKHILVLALAVIANVTTAFAEVKIQKYNVDKCVGDSFLLVLKDTVVYQSGIYDDTLYSEPDTSVNRYVVNFHPVEYTYQSRLLMIGTTFEWFGQTIDKAGTYHTTLKSQFECDSVITLQVTYTYPDPTHLVKTDTAICQGESCTWQGETYTEEGIYYKKYTAHDGQDSVHVLNLRILPVSITIESKIFNSFPFWYRDSLLPAPGTYDIHYVSTTGCDSIVRVVANLATTVVEETASICKGTAYLWHGQTIVAPGIYQDIIKKLSDPTQDSIIYQLKAELIDPIRVERQATICMGDSLIINEGTPSRRVFTQPGIYLDTLKASSTDCDSIVTWIINANPTQLITSEVIWGSDQGPYLWQGRELTASGTYDTVYKNINGCDSTYRLKLTIGSVYRFDTTVYVCSHDLPFIWRGNTYYTAGDYTPFSGKTVQGLDSTLTIHVRISQPSITPVSATICSEEHYVFKGRQLTTPGVYYDTLANAAGCDSIVMLSLNTFNKDTITEYARIAQGQTYLWQGDTLTEAHVYTKTYPSIHGCDSVRRLILSVFETYTFDTVATVCQAQLPFRWHGIEGTQTNTYRKNYVTQQGYDSTYVLHLTVIPTPVVRINKSICKSQTFTFGGKTLSETGVYTDTLHHDGCDSIIILSLNVMEVDTIYEVHRVDEGQTYRYQGVDYVAPQSKEFHYENQYGCDSIVKLVLTVHQVDTIDTTAVICAANRPLIWHGIEGRQTNTYTNIEETPTGNQIVYRMFLTVHEAAHTHIYDNACSGTSYQFGHQYLTQTGTYYDTLTTIYGCDSIVELSLNVFAADTVEETHHIAQGSFFEWRDSVYRTPGIHEKQVKTENNCLRYYRLHLYVHPIYNIDSTVSICANNTPLEWHGIKAYTTGTYHLTYKTVDGYDSIYTLNLTVYPEIPVTHINASICTGSSYIFGEEELTETGTYRHTYKSVNGCDSIVELTLNVFDEGIMRVEKQIAQGDSVVWHGVTYKTPGVFTIHEETEQGCTQTYELTLHVYSTFHHKDSVTICSNEIPYEWHGQKYLETGVYYESFKTVHGYDSTYTLDLTVLPPVEVPVYLKICDNQSVTFLGRQYDSKGTYFDKRGCDTTYKIIVTQLPIEIYTTYAIFDGIHPYIWSFNGKAYPNAGIYDEKFTSVLTGCDSIYRLDLKRDHKFLSEETKVICEGDGFVWRGQQLSLTGVGETKVYYDSLKTVSGLDSVYKLTLTVRPVVHSEQTLTFCDQITISGRTYTQSTTITDTLTSFQYGCDSIVTYHLNRQYGYHFHDTITIMSGESITWRGQTITSEGTHFARFTSVNGCDSIYSLGVGVIPAPEQKYVISTRTIICENDSVEWRGKWIYSAGIYYDSLRTKDDLYDSIYVIHVESRPIYRFTKHLYTCHEGSIAYNGHIYTQSGIYQDTMKTLQGCDSIATLHIHIDASYFHSDTLRASNRDTIEWHGQKIYISGTYTDRHVSPTGCDSIWELVAEIYPTYLFERDTAVCQCETPFLWRGRMVGELGFHTYDTIYRTIYGYDSIYRLNVTVYPQYEQEQQINYCEGGSVLFREKEYNQPGVDTIKLKTIHNCDSFIIVHVNKLPRYHLSEVRTLLEGDTIFWHDTVITQPGIYYDKGYTIAGCDSTFEIIVNRIKVDSTIVQICQVDTPFTWRGHDYYVSTERMEVLKDSLGNDSAIYRLKLTVNQNYITRESYTFCEGESFTYNGKTYFQMGADSVAMDTVHYTTKDHCDSTIIVAIRENPKKYEKITKIIHDGDSILWEGEIIRSAGRYTKTYEQAFNGCDSIIELNVVVEQADTILDWCQKQPYTWRLFNGQDTTFYHNEEYVTDTAFDAAGYIVGFKSLHLEMRPLIDTTIYMRGCMTEGVTYNDVIYKHDTLVNDTLPTCDTIFHLYVKIDTVYNIVINDTVCEYELPYVLGRQKPDTIWQEGSFTHKDTTACGCDSTIILTLRIIPDLHKNDSIIICERDIEAHPVVLGNLYDPNRPIEQLYPDYMDYKHLGDTVHQPKFANLYPDWREWAGTYGPWKGVEYHEDTIVWNCDSSYFFHIIVKPQPIKDSVYYLCEGDSIRFGYNWEDGSERWIKTAGQYWDSIASPTSWEDTKHGRHYDTDTIQCDSLIRLNVIMLPSYHKDTTAHIPMGDSIWWGHQYEYYTGDYDSIMNTDRESTSGEYCHTIYTLHLFVDSTYHYRDTIDVCSDSIKTLSHVWADGHIQYFNTPGIDTTLHYIENIRTAAYHFDSIYDLRVNFHNVARTEIHADICKGDSVQFGFTNDGQPRWIYDKGVYRDTLLSHNRCDSIITLTINWHKSYFESKTIDVSDKQVPYLWLHTQGQDTIIDTLYATGTYTHTYKDVTFGCDSVLELVLNVHKTYLFKDSIEICQDQTPYTWFDENGQAIKTDIYQSGLYRHSLLTHAGYDSIYERKITVYPVHYDTVRQSMCYGSEILFNGQHITEQGTYVDTLTTVHGCDSIVTMIVTVNMPYEHVIREDIYEGASYTFFGQEYTTSGLYKHEGRTPAGCDSITWLHLTVHPIFDTTVTICHKELPYVWVNKWTGDTTLLRSAGVYHDNSHFDEQGNRLFYGIQLIVLEERDTTISSIMCNESFYDFHGRKLTEAGVYHDTLVSSIGCDSIVTLKLTVAYPYYQTQKIDILEGASYPFYGAVYDKTGTYYHYGLTPDGCDSTTVLQLTVHPLVDTIVTICYSELPFAWVNKWTGETTLLYKEGNYRNDTTIVDGQRMFYGLQLNVNRGVDTIIHHSMCRESFYEFNGVKLYEAGTYKDTLRAVNGCDSVITLQLRVNEPYYQTQKIDILEGASYPFYGAVYDKTGTYYHYGLTPDGCDSTTVLQLTVHPLVDTIVTICYSELPYAWVNKWTGETTLLYKEGNYRNDTTIVDGQRMFYGLQLNVNRGSDTIIHHSMCRESFYEFNGVKLYEAGTYKDTLRAVNGCDSVITLQLRVNEPYYQTQKIDILEGASYPFYGAVYDKTGTYYHYGLTPDGCDSTTVLQLTVHPLVDTIVTICYSELPYAWVNKWTGETTLLYKEGNYRNDTTIVDGQRMFYGLQLNVNRSSDTIINHSMCRGSFHTFNGQDLYEAGTYKDTLRNVHGCDSIITLHLRVNDPYFHTETVHIIEGGYTTFFGDTYSTAGVYYHYGLTPDGCDSTTVLQLIVHKQVDSVATVCAKDLPYAWVNRWTGDTTWLHAAGIYRNDSTYVGGEQMFYGLQLVVNDESTSVLNRSFCQGSSIEIDGHIFNEAGTYKYTIGNSKGCDSVITVNIVTHPNYHDFIYKDIFVGDTVWFYDQPYTTPGNYPFSETSVFGCDSIIELVLGVHKLYNDSITICQNELPFPWVSPWNNDTIMVYRDGVYRDTIVDPASGVKSIYSLKVTTRPIIHNDVPPTIKTMCEGDFYIFNGKTLTTAGVYYDTLVAESNGCDSVIAIALQVMPSKSITFTKTIYEGEVVEFHGQQYSEPGTYEYRDKTIYGCDSIERLVLNVLREAHLDTVAYVCDNELPFVWRGKEYWTTGKYQTALESSTGKVMVTLDLTVRPTLYFERDLEFCEGSYLVYRGDTIRESGSFYDTIPAKNGGCDSVIKVTIAVHPKEHYQMSPVTISDQQSYNFFGRILRESGNYEYTTLSAHGCDSIIHMQLIVHPSYHFSDSVDLCRHELPYTYTWNKIANYHTTVINKDKPYYIDSFATVWGFDSIYSLKVNIYDDTFEEQNYTLKAGSSTTIRGIYIDTPGIYMDTLLTKHGCDSIIKMIINPASTVYNEWSPVSMCQGDVYEWFGDKLTKTGSYYHKIESNQGDTIYHLNLVVHQPSLHEERVVICEEDVPYIHHGQAYYHDTLITDSLKDVNGCDSLMRINLIISDRCSDWDQIPLCAGDTLYISGDTITQPGLYQYSKRSCKACPLDSVYRVEVFKATAYESPLIKVVTCSNDTFKVGGKPLLRSGMHDVVLKTIYGCDSIIHVDLTINPSYFIIDTTITTVDYKPIIWRGNTYNTTGIHKVYFSTIKDCDSIHALDLFVIETKRVIVDEEICFGDTLRWRGRELTEPGTYSDTILNYASHTSVIYTLNLGVVSPTFIRSAELMDTCCADNEEFRIRINYRGVRPEMYNVYFDESAHDAGFKDVINQPFGQDPTIVVVPIPKKTQSLGLGHSDYVRPDFYTIVVELDNSVCGVSRSDKMKLEVRYPSWIIEQNWDNVVAPLAPTYNGGYQFGAYEWYINGMLVNNGGMNYLYSNSLKENDQVVMKVTRMGDNYALRTCPLTITKAKPDKYENPILITPSSTPRHQPDVTIQSQEEGEYFVFSSTGHLIEKGNLEEEGELKVTLPSVAGCYIIQANTKTGYSVNQKVLLY